MILHKMRIDRDHTIGIEPSISYDIKRDDRIRGFRVITANAIQATQSRRG